MEFSQDLLNKFAAHFPGIDLSGVDTGYDKTEKLLLSHVTEFTREQWETILSSEFNALFQTGTPHINWRNDREHILYRLLEVYKPKPFNTYSETWWDVREYSIQTATGVCLELTIKEPRSFSGGSYHYRIRIVEEVTPVPTHRAILIGISKDTTAHIVEQFAGTQDECENWVAKKLHNGMFFKIMSI